MPHHRIGDDLRRTLAAGKSLFSRVFYNPDDLGSQLEDLFVEVWRQEQFERQHPFTCAVIRESNMLQLSIQHAFQLSHEGGSGRLK